ncbi:MAG: 2-amino-4-hydroxy-6-hydroxymethyldihydropteridine diphosphokinase [Bacteroidia bacterium]|nr:MAG: 2-amino-4-hydroxy-6-hydroxymethyldihydropteridine diphosphokinase [Bacteroidia bacterium]
MASPRSIRYTLGLGGNIRPRRSALSQAIDLIATRCGTVEALSPRYMSEPWGFEADTWFINQNITLLSDLPPLALLDHLLTIEHELGRRRNPLSSAYASRPIDIDILLAGDLRLDHPRLQIPHPHLAARRFVLLPLLDLLPHGVHPTLGTSYAELLDSCPDRGACEKI